MQFYFVFFSFCFVLYHFVSCARCYLTVWQCIDVFFVYLWALIETHETCESARSRFPSFNEDQNRSVRFPFDSMQSASSFLVFFFLLFFFRTHLVFFIPLLIHNPKCFFFTLFCITWMWCSHIFFQLFAAFVDEFMYQLRSMFHSVCLCFSKTFSFYLFIIQFWFSLSLFVLVFFCFWHTHKKKINEKKDWCQK